MGAGAGWTLMTLQSTARPSRRPVAPPSKWLAATELPRAIAEAGLFTACLPTLWAFAPRGDGHPVLVLPGMLANDSSTAPLRAALEVLSYDARGWGLGRNYGTRAAGDDGEHLLALIDTIYHATGRKLSLVGWSLGGILARLAARRVPHQIRQVVTLGSPFAARPSENHGSRVYEAVSGTRLGDPAPRAMIDELRRALGVPSTAIYSKADGICAWQGCRTRVSSRAENIEVLGSHCGLGANPMVFHALADRLAQPEGEWKPFKARGLSAWIFPSAGRA